MSYGNPTDKQIAAVRHRFFVKPSPPYPDPVKRPMEDLSTAEKKNVAANRAAVHAMGADAVDFVKELHEAGLIDGWRSVIKVEFLKEGKEHGTA